MDLTDSLIAAAKADGLTPVIEEAGTVDLQIRDGDRVVAAIRVHVTEDRLDYEAPARTGPDGTGRVIQPWATGLVRPNHMRDLDRWWARISGTGRTWQAKPEPWMRVGFWEGRIGRTPGHAVLA